ncbi:hypothetical protein Tco_0812142 [Tanacetum coccineum]
MHILKDPSFFFANKTGAPHGAKWYGARATGAVPGINSIWNSTCQGGGSPGPGTHSYHPRHKLSYELHPVVVVVVVVVVIVVIVVIGVVVVVAVMPDQKKLHFPVSVMGVPKHTFPITSLWLEPWLDIVSPIIEISVGLATLGPPAPAASLVLLEPLAPLAVAAALVVSAATVALATQL